MTNPRLQLPALRRSWWGTWRPTFLAHPSLAPDGTTDLAEGEIVSLDPHLGLRIGCVRGTLWITQAGDAEDFVARAGDEFVPGPRGRIVIQAMAPARVGVSTVSAVRPKLYAGHRPATCDC